MKLFLATLTAAVLATSAYAGQIKDKRFLTGAPDISSACKGAFDDSDEAFIACRRPYVVTQFGQFYSSLACNDYKAWKNLPARKAEAAERARQESIRPKNEQVISVIGDGIDEDEARLAIFAELPAEDIVMIESICLNRAQWISKTLDNELIYMKRIVEWN